MSRIGKLPVAIPSGVKFSSDGGILTVEGPKGKLTQVYEPYVTFKTEGNEVIVSRIDESKEARSRHGLYRQLLKNMVVGVTDGYTTVLVINGVGYKAELKGTNILLL